MCSGVSFQVGGIGKRLGTVVTLEGFLTTVDSLVTPKVGRSLESGWTLSTGKGFLFTVYGFVTSQVRGGEKLGRTQVAQVSLFPSVD